jgi:hypothetical protein
MTQHISNAMGKMIAAPLADGTTIAGHSGIMVTETVGQNGEVVVSIGVVIPNGMVLGVLLDPKCFDDFCRLLAPYVERANDRADAAEPWRKETVQ